MFNYTDTQVISSANAQAKKAIAFFTTNSANITKVKKTPYSASVLTKAETQLSGLTPNSYYRMEVFIRLNDSAQSEYSNALVFKEKPVYFEFKTPVTVDAPAITAIVKQFNAEQTRYGNPILVASSTGTTLTVTGMTEFQTIADAYVSEWKTSTELDSYKGDFVKMASTATTITKGKVAFGSYEWILRNLRIPTMENRRFTTPNELEMPVPGVRYNQYTIYFKKDRGVMGGAAVGQTVTSETCHVFYVNSTLTTDYCTALDALASTNHLQVILSDDMLDDSTAGTTNVTVSYLNEVVIPATLTVTATTLSNPVATITVGTIGGLTVLNLGATVAADTYVVTATYVRNGETFTATTNLTVA